MTLQTDPFIYYDQGKTFTADRCKAVINAVEQDKTRLNALTRAGYPGKPLRTKELPNVLSVGYWDAVGTQDWGLATHRNEGIELTFMETGGTDFTVNNDPFHLKPGSLTVVRPWQPHSLGGPNIGAGRLHWIILDVGVRRPHQKWKWPDWFILSPEVLKKLTRLLSHNETPVWHASSEISYCFGQIAAALEKEDSSCHISHLAVLINQLFLNLYEMLDNKKIILEPKLTTSQRTVELFLQNLRENPKLLYEPWTVEMMAGYCDIGLTHFTHLCREISNMTPMKYLNYYRIESAVQILKSDPNRSITDIAFDCGFSSSQYFATVFRQIKGVSPSQYR
ncbi:MAG: AraC family transcriptional regulator [Phycisphaerae bacterium]|nr:AraC family transcriptional regulator [Phycisphaerae bacterium]